MAKLYGKIIDKNGTVEYAPLNKGAILNYGHEKNEKQLLKDGYCPIVENNDKTGLILPRKTCRMIKDQIEFYYTESDPYTLMTVEELKEHKKLKMNEMRDALQTGGFMYKDMIFDNDMMSLSKMRSAKDRLEYQKEISGDGSKEPSITWTCKNGALEMTLEDFKLANIENEKMSSMYHEACRKIKAKIEAVVCKSDKEADIKKAKAEIEAIEWSVD